MMSSMEGRRSFVQKRHLQQVQQAAACIQVADKRRVSHQENLLHEPEDAVAALTPRDAHATFRNTASIQSNAAFEHESNAYLEKEAKQGLLGRLRWIAAGGVNAASIAFIMVGIFVRMEQISVLGLSGQSLMLLGCLVLFVHSHQLQSPMEAIRDESNGSNKMNRAKLAAMLLLIAPSSISPSSSLSTCVLIEASRMLMASSLYACSNLLKWAVAATYASWVAFHATQLQRPSTGGTQTVLETSFDMVAEWMVPLLISLALWVAATRTSDATQRTSERKILEHRTVSLCNSLTESMLSSLMLPPRLSKLVTRPLSQYGLWMEELPATTVCFVSFSRVDFEHFQNPHHFLILIGHCISMFDQVVTEQGLCKLEHVGEDYVVTSTCVRDGPSSLSQTQFREEAVRLVKLAQVLIDVSKKLTVGESNKLRLHFRAGLHSGPCVGAIAGKHRRFYRLFGDTVNTAARMCQHAPPGGVHMSQSVFDLVQGHGLNLMERGVTNIKGKGPMATYVSLRQSDNKREEHLHEKVQSVLTRNIELAGESGQLSGWMVGQFTDNRRHSTITSTAILSEKRRTTMLSLDDPCDVYHNSPLFLEKRETNSWHPMPKANGGGPDPSQEEFLAGEKVSDGEIAKMWEVQSNSESVNKHCSKASSVEEGQISSCVQSRPHTPDIKLDEDEWELPPHYNRAGSYCCSKDRHLAFRRSTMTFSDKAARFEWLNDPDAPVRRSASFDFGSLNVRTLDPSEDHPKPQKMLAMTDILEDLRACFPQSMHDELHETMKPAMDLERWAPAGHGGVGRDKIVEAKEKGAANCAAPAVDCVQLGSRCASLAPAPALSTRSPRGSGSSASSIHARTARSALFWGPASSRRSSASASSVEMARAIESARIVEEAEVLFDSPHDEHVTVNQPWREDEDPAQERVRVGSLGRRRASMIPQDLYVFVPSEGLSSLAQQTTTPQKPPGDRDERLLHWCQEQQALEPPPMDLDSGVNTPVDGEDDVTPTTGGSTCFSWDNCHSTDSDNPLASEESPNSTRDEFLAPKPADLQPRPGLGLLRGRVDRVSRLSGARRANFPGARRNVQLGGRTDETAVASESDASTNELSSFEQSPGASQAHSSKSQHSGSPLMNLQRQRLPRHSEPWRAETRRESAPSSESHIKRKLASVNGSSGFAQGMTEPYVSDLLGFCEKFSSRSRNTQEWKEMMEKGSTGSQTALGVRDTMVSECPSMALSEEGSDFDSPFHTQPNELPLQEFPAQVENYHERSFHRDIPSAGLETTPISRQARSVDVEKDTVQYRTSVLHDMSTEKEIKVWKILEADSSSTHCMWLGGFKNKQVEQCFTASSLQHHRPYFWPMFMKAGLYAALAINLWHSLPPSLPIWVRAVAAATLVVCVSAARIPLAHLMPDPYVDPSWTRVLPVGVCGMLLESLQPNCMPLSLAAYLLLLFTCDTFDFQKPLSVVATLAALLTPLLGEAIKVGGLLLMLVTEQALLLYVIVVLLWLTVRKGRRQTRLYWQVQHSLQKRNQQLSTVWCDLVPSVSAREFIFQRRVWMDFSKSDEETLLERYSLWVQVERSHAVVLAMDMVNFTPLANSLTPCQVVHLLHEIWCLVDECVRDPKLGQVGAVKEVEQNTMFKMDTIGDAYITVHLVEADAQEMQAAAVERVMQLAVNIQCELLALSVWKTCAGEMAPGSLRFRMGLSCDPVVAGVVGLLQPRYHVFGAAVENARHLEARAGGGMLRLQDKCDAMLPWLNGVNMLDLETYNQEDTPALVEMCSGFMETLGVNGKALQRPAIHRRLAEYIKVVENTKDNQDLRR